MSIYCITRVLWICLLLVCYLHEALTSINGNSFTDSSDIPTNIDSTYVLISPEWGLGLSRTKLRAARQAEETSMTPTNSISPPSSICNINALISQLTTACKSAAELLDTDNVTYLLSNDGMSHIETFCTADCAGNLLEFDKQCPYFFRMLDDYVRGLCSMNSDFRCALSLTVNDGSKVYSKCFEQNTSRNSCPSHCENALIEFSSEIGCCINTYYNDTYSFPARNEIPGRDQVVNPELWDRCAVSYPTECPNDYLAPDQRVTTSMTLLPTQTLTSGTAKDTGTARVFADVVIALLILLPIVILVLVVIPSVIVFLFTKRSEGKGTMNDHVMQGSSDMIINESYSTQESFWATEGRGQNERELHNTATPSSAQYIGMDTKQRGVTVNGDGMGIVQPESSIYQTPTNQPKLQSQEAKASHAYSEPTPHAVAINTSTLGPALEYSYVRTGPIFHPKRRESVEEIEMEYNISYAESSLSNASIKSTSSTSCLIPLGKPKPTVKPRKKGASNPVQGVGDTSSREHDAVSELAEETVAEANSGDEGHIRADINASCGVSSLQ